MKRVRLALVGCGAITATGHLPAALRSPYVDVSALVDLNIANAHTLAQRFAVECEITDRLETVIDRVDGVVIATPNDSHVPIAELALRHGVPTLIEKPLTIAYDDAIKLCDLADSHNAFIAVAYRSRFWPNVRLLKQLIAGNSLGRILSFKYAFGTHFSWAAVSGFSIDPKLAGGGVLIDAHSVDKMIYWFGEPIEFTYSDDSNGGLEATCKAAFVFNGTKPGETFTGKLFLSRTMQLDNKITIETDTSWCELGESPTARVTLRHKQQPDLVLEVARIGELRSAEDTRTDFQAQLEEFAANIERRGPITVDGRFGALSVKLIEAMYRNRRPLSEPWVRRSTELERANVTV